MADLAGRDAQEEPETSRISEPPTSPGATVEPDPPASPRRRRRRTRLLAVLATLGVLVGVPAGAGAWYYDSVPVPAVDLVLPETATFLFANGQEMARLGELNRTVVDAPENLRRTVVSAQDRTFYEHSGLDFARIARTVWGGDAGDGNTSASTITEQYARGLADLGGRDVSAKTRVAIMARKLEQQYSKDEILDGFLNMVYFGRGAYGVEAAAQAYFSRPASALSVAQAAVLAAVLKQPEPVSGGHQGYDPAHNEPAARQRWNYVLDGMVEKGWLDGGTRAGLRYPEVNRNDADACVLNCLDRPTGNIVRYVIDELEAMGYTDWKSGGYRVTTSIKQGMQVTLERTVRRSVPGSGLNGQPANLMAAMVAVDPATGRVVAYYGGENGTGIDYAGTTPLETNRQGATTQQGGAVVGGHPPGNSFAIYTLAAGLTEGVAVGSRWDALAVRDGAITLSNRGRVPQCGRGCTLEQSAHLSYVAPFYWLTKGLGAAKVVDTAKAAGIRHLWTDSGEGVDLTAASGGAVAPAKFDTPVGYGQYGVTVLDHASGLATFAARGVHRTAHFVVSVQKRVRGGEWKPIGGERLTPRAAVEPDRVDDVVAVLAGHPGPALDGRPSARLTGEWELNTPNAPSTQSTPGAENGDAWMVGFTPQLAAAVWVGNVRDRGPLRYAPDLRHPERLVTVQGSNLPALIWQRFMNDVHRGLPVAAFPERRNTGRVDHPLANGSPAPGR
jgi:membrane peptidoglycan carboxypeptidase